MENVDPNLFHLPAPIVKALYWSRSNYYRMCLVIIYHPDEFEAMVFFPYRNAMRFVNPGRLFEFDPAIVDRQVLPLCPMEELPSSSEDDVSGPY